MTQPNETLNFIYNFLNSPFWFVLSIVLGFCADKFRRKWKVSEANANNLSFLFKNYKLVTKLEESSEQLSSQLTKQAKYLAMSQELDPIKVSEIRDLISEISYFDYILCNKERESISKIGEIISSQKPNFNVLDDHLHKLSGYLKTERMYHHDYNFTPEKRAHFKTRRSN